MQTFSKDMVDGMYKGALAYTEGEKNLKCQPLQFMGMQAYNNGVWPDDQKLERLTAKMVADLGTPEWATKKRREIKELAAHKWVLNEYFKDRGVTMSGDHADSMEKAFSVSPAELTVFPFFWDTIIIESLLAVPLLDILVAQTQNINSGTAVHAVMNETVLDRSIGLTGEFASFQEVNVSSTESTIRLLKFGGQLSISDEAMRRQRIDIFQRGFARYGRQIAIDITDLAVDILLNGDSTYGGTGAAVPTVACASTGNPSYADYVKAMMKFPIGYQPTDYMMGASGITKLLNVPQFEDPLAGFAFQSRGVYPRQFGLEPHRWDSTKSTSWSPGGVSGDSTTELLIQRDRALMMYTEGGLQTEMERDARMQTQVIVTSWYLAFAVADRLAAVSLTGVA